jgi:SAM-dependent methyltransferase
MSHLKEIKYWLSDADLKSIYTSTYWNNIEKEKEKEWWIKDGNYNRCLHYIKSSGLLSEYQDSEKFIQDFSREVVVADLASGIGWTSALLSKLPNVTEVHAVEISKHRLGVLFENAVKMLKGEGQKIYRYLGSFYDLKFKDNSIDIIYMSQAFHHAEKPFTLIAECDRVLSEDGRIILVGEHYMGPKQMIKKAIANLIKRKIKGWSFYEIFPPDEELGDHYYRISDYYFLFSSMGYNLKHYRCKKGKVIYIADKV